MVCEAVGYSECTQSAAECPLTLPFDRSVRAREQRPKIMVVEKHASNPRRFPHGDIKCTRFSPRHRYKAISFFTLLTYLHASEPEEPNVVNKNQ